MGDNMTVSIGNIFQDQLQAQQLQQVQNHSKSNDTRIQSMTYNIRTDGGDGTWEQRKDNVLAIIEGVNTSAHRDNGQSIGQNDFVGIQEAETPYQWNDILKGMESKGYKLVPQGDCYSSQGNMLFYNPNKVKLQNSGMFHVKAVNIDPKNGKDNIRREAVWGHFQMLDPNTHQPTGQDMYAFTSHFPRWTEASLQQVSDKIHDVMGTDSHDIPVVFMGDLNDKNYDHNGRPSYDSDGAFDWRGYKDSYEMTNPDDRGTTDHAKGWGKQSSHREDIIFAGDVDWDNPNNSTDIIHWTPGGKRSPSDHYAVVSDLYFKNPNSSETQAAAKAPARLEDVAGLTSELANVGQLDGEQNPFGQNNESELF